MQYVEDKLYKDLYILLIGDIFSHVCFMNEKDELKGRDYQENKTFWCCAYYIDAYLTNVVRLWLFSKSAGK